MMNFNRCLMKNMVNTMIKFSDLLKADYEREFEYADERLISNLYYTSLSYSLREEKNSEVFKEKNKWLFNSEDINGRISTINFDVLPKLCGCEAMSSCDAFFYDYNGNRKSLLIEFKNCDKATLQNKYFKSTSNDSIIRKIKDSKNLISSQLYFEGKYTGIDLVLNTHIIIVYGGKNNIPSKNITPSYIPKVKRSEKGKPTRASSMLLTKSVNEENDRFGLEIKKIGFSKCISSDFPVPGEPDFIKSKGIGKTRNYTFYSASDFKQLIDKGYFSGWDWGDYATYILGFGGADDSKSPTSLEHYDTVD